MADLGLPDAVDPTKALLNAVGVPREVVVDEEIRSLEVDALASRIRGDQEGHIWSRR